MPMYPRTLENLIEELKRLPAVGPKTAQRLAFHIIGLPPSRAKSLAESIVKARQSLRPCRQCGGISEDELCPVCQDPRRDQTCICVVATAKDMIAVERTGEYHGLYHVLGGLISPLDGIGPEDIRLEELEARLDGINELIIATNPTVAGEATALYIQQLAGSRPLKITRPATGLPAGADLEYADELTLGRALRGRRDF